jgi:hypothetical protein
MRNEVLDEVWARGKREGVVVQQSRYMLHLTGQSKETTSNAVSLMCVMEDNKLTGKGTDLRRYDSDTLHGHPCPNADE